MKSNSKDQMKIGGQLISKEEIEILLKKGIVGLIDDKDGTKSKAFTMDNIETILSNNTRMA